MVVVNKAQPLRCAITDLGAASLETPASRLVQLRKQVRRWVLEGIDVVQLREKQLESGELLALTDAAVAVLREMSLAAGTRRPARLLVNGRPDVAAAGGAHGVHLTARPGEMRPAQARQIFAAAGISSCLVSVSCHTFAEVTAACQAGADLILFGPVFEKRVENEVVTGGLGIGPLREACSVAGNVPVLALGGVSEDTIPCCLATGAAGVAGIRLFA